MGFAYREMRPELLRCPNLEIPASDDIRDM